MDSVEILQGELFRMGIGIEVKQLRYIVGRWDELNTAGAITPHIRITRDDLEEALSLYNFNRRQAAKRLGISERTLFRWIKKHGLNY